MARKRELEGPPEGTPIDVESLFPPGAPLAPTGAGALGEVSQHPQRWKVSLRDPRRGSYHPVTGLVDRAGAVAFTRRPTEEHYHRPGDGSKYPMIPPGWHTARALAGMGLAKVPDDFLRKPYPRSDLTGFLFQGLVVEARGEHEARERYCEQAGVNDAPRDHWRVELVSADTPLGPCDPIKARGPEAQRRAG